MNDNELGLWRAEREITRVILSYARGVDERDWPRVRACFHSGARISYGDFFHGDLSEMMAFLEASVPRLVSTLHCMGPPWIEIDIDGGTARGETYSVNAATYPPDENGVSIQNVSGVRYLDLFERRDGVWALVERRNRRVWSHNLPDTGEPPMPSPLSPDDGGRR